MKKKIKLSILIFFTIIMIYNIKSLATFFDIDNYVINCELTEEGNLKVQENITYTTDEYRNGVTRDINTKNELNAKNSADLMQLESVKVDGIDYSRVPSGTNGRKGIYEYKINGNEYSIKVYTPFMYEGKTITYEYTLKNVGVKYDDIAELYWNFIGDKWDTNINNVEINIKLPRNAAQNSIYVFGHGSDNGTFEKDMNNITLKASGLQANQALDARILFSRDAMSNSSKIINKNVLQSYIKNEEEGFRKEREEAKIIGTLTIKQLVIIIVIIIIIIWIVLYLLYDKEYEVKSEKYYREIPYDLDPEMLQYIYYGKEQRNTLWITFLNLLKKGVYSIEKITNKVNVETYNITYNNKPLDLKDYQKSFIKLLNSYMNTDEDGTKSIDLLSLKSRMKNGAEYEYRKYIENLENEKQEMFGETKKTPNIAKIVSIVVMIIVILLIGMLSLKDIITLPMLIFELIITTIIYTVLFAQIGFKNIFLNIVLLVHFSAFQSLNINLLMNLNIGIMYIPYLLAFTLIQYVYRIKRQSKEYREARGKIKGLRNYIKDYSLLSKSDLEHMSLWEEYFIMAVALRVNKKATNYLYDCCNSMTNNLNFSNSLTACGTYAIFATTMREPFTRYVSSYVYPKLSSSSSSSGSRFSGGSGGFSGGSSSGGGGRWRRRRKLLLRRKVIFKICIIQLL